VCPSLHGGVHACLLAVACSGDVYEQAVYLSALQKDDATFERHFSQLKPLYTDVRCVHPQKQRLGSFELDATGAGGRET
jgi:hypothetical protein